MWLVLIAGVAAAAVVLALAVAQWTLRPLPRGVKHVRGLPLVGSAVAMGRDGAALLARHGPTFAMYMLRRPTLVLTHHADILAVSKQPRVFAAEPVQAAFAEAVCGTKASASLEVTDAYIHSLWPRYLGGAGLNPSTAVASRRLVRELSGVPGSYLGDAVGTAAAGDWTVVPRWYDLVFRLLFAAGFPAVMGAGMDPRPLVEAMGVLDNHVPLMVAGFPKMFTAKGFAALDAIGEVFRQQLVAAGLWTQDEPEILRNADGELAVSGLQMDRSKHFRDSGVYTVRDIAGMSVLIAWALQTNTAPGAFWSIVHLLASPAALAAVRAEVDAVAAAHPTFPLELPTTSASANAGAGDEGVSVNASTVYDKLFPVLTAATWESLRLATAPMIAREVTEACDITLPSTGETCSLQPGDSVYMVPTQHWDASLYPDPRTYDHTRFLAKATDAAKPRLPSMVFGTGAHMCPGRFLALNEIRAFVFVLLRDWDLELVAAGAGELPALDRTRFGLGVMPPATEMPVKIRRRMR